MSAKFVCVEDYESEARERLDRNAWAYYSSGATTQHTLRDNVNAFSRYMIRPVVLRDVSKINMKTTILGEQIDFPIGISPTAMQCLAHHDGEKATAKASAKLKTCMILSSWSTTSMEEVASANGSNLRWFQLYIYNDKGLTLDLVKRAEKAGYKALAVTVDTPELGNRYSNERYQFSLPPHLGLGNFKKGTSHNTMTASGSFLHEYTKKLIDASLTWKSIDWLHLNTSLPIIVKGVLRGEDAKEALKHGVKGILVSNHGARQLDGVPATIDVLTEVVDAVRGSDIEVYLDGGIRHGTDALKALALGARAVFVGRPVLWGLACNGEDGVHDVMSLLREELRQSMVLSGCSSIDDIHHSHKLVVHSSDIKAKL
jgi:(S)-2-hydroxy-acid oxidase